MEGRPRSDVWNHFKKVDGGMARCLACSAKFSYKSTITNLKGHLRRKHFSVFSNLTTLSQKSQDDNSQASTSSYVVVVPSETTEEVVTSEGNEEIIIAFNDITPAKHVKRPPTRKRTVESCVIPQKVTPDQKKQIDEDLLNLFISDFQPFRLLEDIGFTKLMKWIPGYELPTRKTISSLMIPALYFDQLSLVKETVSNEASTVCITTEIWTSRNDVESFMAVTAHYIDNNFNFKTVLLNCSNLPENHTAAFLAEELNKILTDWDLIGKVIFAVSDNSSTIVEALDILQLKHFGCYAHKLNLIIQDAVVEMKTTISYVKKMVAYYRRNVIATDKLLEYQSAQGCSYPKRLKRDIPTRWNSVFYMLERFIELEEAIKATMELLDEGHPVITTEEWQACKDLCDMLKPFEEMTGLISGEKYMTGSSVIVFTRCLINVCEKIKQSDAFTNSCESVKEVLSQIEKGLNNYIKDIEHNNTLTLCTFFDPRYKTSVFSDSTIAKTNVIEMVSHIIGKSPKSTSESENVETVQTDDTSERTSTVVKAWDIFKEILSVPNARDKTPLTRTIEEVDAYLADDILPLKDEDGKLNCQFDWWNKHQYLYPNLAKVFKLKCNIIATSVPCERLFSKKGQLISSRRSVLTTQKLEMLVFLNANTLIQQKNDEI